jgi:hypothetical protein
VSYNYTQSGNAITKLVNSEWTAASYMDGTTFSKSAFSGLLESGMHIVSATMKIYTNGTLPATANSVALNYYIEMYNASTGVTYTTAEYTTLAAIVNADGWTTWDITSGLQEIPIISADKASANVYFKSSQYCNLTQATAPTVELVYEHGGGAFRRRIISSLDNGDGRWDYQRMFLYSINSGRYSESIWSQNNDYPFFKNQYTVKNAIFRSALYRTPSSPQTIGLQYQLAVNPINADDSLKNPSYTPRSAVAAEASAPFELDITDGAAISTELTNGLTRFYAYLYQSSVSETVLDVALSYIDITTQSEIDITAPTTIDAYPGTVDSGSTFTLTWSGAAGNPNNAIYGYKIYSCATADGDYTPITSNRVDAETSETSGSIILTVTVPTGGNRYYKAATVGQVNQTQSTLSADYATVAVMPDPYSETATRTRIYNYQSAAWETPASGASDSKALGYNPTYTESVYGVTEIQMPAIPEGYTINTAALSLRMGSTNLPETIPLYYRLSPTEGEFTATVPTGAESVTLSTSDPDFLIALDVKNQIANYVTLGQPFYLYLYLSPEHPAAVSAYSYPNAALNINTSLLPTSAPTSVKITTPVTAPSADVRLYWSGAEVGDSTAITGYSVYRATSESGSYALLGSVTTSATKGNMLITAPTAAGNSYYYKIVTLGDTEVYNSSLSTAYAVLTAQTQTPYNGILGRTNARGWW